MKSFTILKEMPAKILLVATTLFVFTTSQALGNPPLQDTAPSSPNKPLVIGHRGAAGLAPENTLAAIRRALAIGVDAIELDVQLTADNKIAVYHDFTLKPEITRTPDGEWLDMWTGRPIKDLSLAQLKTYDVGRLKPYTAYARRYPKQQPTDGERIPALSEVIQLLQGYHKAKPQLWIEIKTSPEKPKVSGAPVAVANAVIEILRQKKFSRRVKILAFDWAALVHVQKIAPDIPTVYLSHIGSRLNTIKPGQSGPSPWTAGIDVDDYDGSIPAAIKAAGGPFWAAHYKYVTPANLAEAHTLGLKVFVWTPDHKRDMGRLIKLGVDGIITNRPDILRSLCDRN